MQETRGSRRGWTPRRADYGLNLFWVRGTQTVLIFSSFGIVIFFTFNTGSESEIAPMWWWLGWSLTLLLTPFGIKLVPTLWAYLQEFLQQTTKKGNIIDTTRKDLFLFLPLGRKNCYKQFLYLPLECTLFGENLWMKPKFPNLHFICFRPFTCTVLTVLHGNGW